MRYFHVLFTILMAAALLLGGCMTPLEPLVPKADPQPGPIGFFAEEREMGAIAVRLVDARVATQALGSADPTYTAVRFELQNAAKLKSSRVVGVAKQPGGVYAAVFTGLPSDAQARYTLKASLHKGVATPTNLLDAGYANSDNKVGEGTSASFSVTPGDAKSVTLTINALGPITLASNVAGFSDASAVFELGDGTARFSTPLSAISNPGATHLTYAFYPPGLTSGGPIGPVFTVPAGAWAGTVSQSLSLPAALGTYNLVVDMIGGSTLLSRRVRQVAVATPAPRVTLTGTDPYYSVNGVPWDYFSEPQRNVSVVVVSPHTAILVTNATTEPMYASLNGGQNMMIGPNSSLSFPASPGTHTISIT